MNGRVKVVGIELRIYETETNVTTNSDLGRREHDAYSKWRRKDYGKELMIYLLIN